MYEYTVYNLTTKEEDIIFGYSVKNACRRYNLSLEKVQVLTCDYID